MNRVDDLPKRCHGDDGVPECLGNAGKGCFSFVLLRVEHDRRKHNDRHRQREQKKTKFAGARLERVAEDPQTLNRLIEVLTTSGNGVLTSRFIMHSAEGSL